ncbi:MAG: UPF0280 family protein [Candidatus Omnitrophica bacterium]|nr:UPF0280 family protein [Candidatus Omnitrophota bacterium]
MKSLKYQKRFYRKWYYPRDLFSKIVVFRETDLQILCDKLIEADYVLARVEKYRRQIELYICRDEKFLSSLKPLTVELTAPMIVREMAASSRKANVGPMAAVAGAIAEYIGKDLLRKGAKTVIIENGGDIFLKTERPVKVGLFAGKTKLLSRLKLKIKPQDTPLGICASSGTIGHSLSFGYADCVVIIAQNALLADATATATANRVRDKKDLESAVKFARSIKGIRGVAIILKNNLASWGEIEFV